MWLLPMTQNSRQKTAVSDDFAPKTAVKISRRFRGVQARFLFYAVAIRDKAVAKQIIGLVVTLAQVKE